MEKGLPVSPEGKDEYSNLRSEVISRLKPEEQSIQQSAVKPKEEESKTNTIVIPTGDNEAGEAAQGDKNLVLNIERFVTRIRMVAQSII